MMFEKDGKVVKDFVMLRFLLVVTFVGLFVMWMTFFGWVAWRLGPGGYSAADAQMDRERMCAEIKNHHPGETIHCPRILEHKGE